MDTRSSAAECKGAKARMGPMTDKQLAKLVHPRTTRPKTAAAAAKEKQNRQRVSSSGGEGSEGEGSKGGGRAVRNRAKRAKAVRMKVRMRGRAVLARKMGRAARKSARGRAVGMRRERAWTRLLNLND